MGSQLCPTMVIKGHFLLLLMAFTVRGEMISLSPADADTKIAAGYFDIIVDVRNCQEFDQGHISGALNLKGTSAVQQLAGCEDKKIGVYCWTGPDRATPAATALADAGFLEVSDVGGLQFLSTPTVQGRWDTALPSCAAGKSGSDDSTLCYLVFAVGGLVLLMFFGCWAYFCCCRKPIAPAEQSGPTGVIIHDASDKTVTKMTYLEPPKYSVGDTPSYSTTVVVVSQGEVVSSADGTVVAPVVGAAIVTENNPEKPA